MREVACIYFKKENIVHILIPRIGTALLSERHPPLHNSPILRIVERGNRGGEDFWAFAKHLLTNLFSVIQYNKETMKQ